MKIIKFFPVPTQVTFVDDENEFQGGIAFEDKIICGCCGGIFETEETPVEIFDNWVNFSKDII
jgi:hypothetical protein